MTPEEVLEAQTLFWALSPGFNVHASTAKHSNKNATDSSNTWKALAHETNGPYLLTYIQWTTLGGPYADGAVVRITVDGNVLEYSFISDEGGNVLPFPIIAKGELKIEIKKLGTYANPVFVRARFDRLVVQ